MFVPSSHGRFPPTMPDKAGVMGVPLNSTMMPVVLPRFPSSPRRLFPTETPSAGHLISNGLISRDRSWDFRRRCH